MRKTWIIKDSIQCSEFEGTSKVVLEILAGRGYSSPDEVTEFLSAKPKLTYDPFLLKNMAQAVDRIIDALAANKRICIYGDYDTDGVTAICLLLDFLGNLTQNLTYYVPSRFEEGYGLNKDAIDHIAADGVDLIITVDCGSTSVSEVEHAKALGIEIIVTDHHSINERIADCLVINPKQEGCDYPFKELCGCGVAFKLAQAIQRQKDLDRTLLTKLLDLVAIATIGDIVPLADENRTLVKHGMEVVNQGKRPGLTRLVEATGIGKQPLRSYQIAFVIVPHLNAAGRMAEAAAGIRLLTAKDEHTIAEAASTLVDNNNDRKRIQEADYKICLDIVKKKHEDDLFMIVNAGHAHEGITGIIAGKIKDAYGKPVIIVTNSNGDGLLKGTGRSIEGLSIYELLKKHEDLFIKFGGHAGACGFLMEAGNLEKLRDALNKSLLGIYNEDTNLFVDKLKIDLMLTLADIDRDMITQLEKLEPYGHKNERPIFVLEKVKVSAVCLLGDDRQHVRFSVQQDERTMECILFNEAAEYKDELEKGSLISLAGYPDINTWNGNSKIQFVVRDIRCYSDKVE